jgi:hypothetical protein
MVKVLGRQTLMYLVHEPKAFSEHVTHYGCGYHLGIWSCSTFVEYMTQYKKTNNHNRVEEMYHIYHPNYCINSMIVWTTSNFCPAA